ncbi:MAG: hypothetical protein JXO72_06525 [Vicinamibacteria bacterium]|nr:hypothetical protein [Vicinamibacteria bacterium]
MTARPESALGDSAARASDARERRASGRAWKDALIVFILTLTISLVVFFPSLTWPMVFDDVHLLRPMSLEEVARSFASTWDIAMTRGYRPLSVVFNCLRYKVFGENVAAHRIFLIVLLALYWTSLTMTLKSRLIVIVPAVMIFIGGTYSVFHVVWITDGNHMLQGLIFVTALWCVMRFAAETRGGTWMWFWAALFCALLALLVREDSLAAFPALVLIPLARRGRRPRVIAFTASLAALVLGFLSLRHWLEPRADHPGLNLTGYLATTVRALMTPTGLNAFDGLSRALLLIWVGCSIASIVIVCVQKRRGALAWLLCAVLASSSGLNVSREDLLFFPATFAALYYANAASGLFKPYGTILFVAVALINGMHTGRAYAENFHPQSLRSIWWNGRYVYGAYARHARIPEERRAGLIAQLAEARVNDKESHERRNRKMVKWAIRDKRRRPGKGFFYPAMPWMED